MNEEIILRGLLNWWRDYCVIDSKEKPSLTPPKMPSFSGYIEMSKLSDVDKMGLELLYESPFANQTNSESYDNISRLFARALTMFLPESGRFWKDIQLATLLCENNIAFQKELESLVCTCLAASTPDRQKWLDAISLGKWDSSRAIYSIDKGQLAYLEKEWKTTKDPISIWNDRIMHINILEESFLPVTILLKANASEWIAEFERLPLPIVKQTFINSNWHIFTDRIISDMICKSSPVFDEGTWTRNTAALYALTLILRSVFSDEQLRDDYSIDVEQSEAKLIEFFSKYRKRTQDGIILLQTIQLWLLNEYRSSIRRKSSKSHEIALNAITKELAKSNEQRTEGGWSELLGEVLLDDERSKHLSYANDNALSHWNWFCNLLKAQDKDLLDSVEQFITNDQLNLSAHWSGRCLANLPTVQESWEQAWDSFDMQREEIWHSEYNYRSIPLLTSIALLEAGLGSLSWMATEGKDINEVDDLWKLLVKSTFSIWIRQGRTMDEKCTRTFVRAIAWICVIKEGNIKPHFLYLISLIGDDNELISTIIFTLKVNGISTTDIKTWVANSDIDIAMCLEQLIKWEEWSQKPKSHQLEDIQKLRSELTTLK